MPKKLETMDAETLMTIPMEPLKFIVSGLLPQGLHILAGSPKIGKSWLALWICLQVAKGEKVWELETLQSEVLYLCLEDSFQEFKSWFVLVGTLRVGNCFWSLTKKVLYGIYILRWRQSSKRWTRLFFFSVIL